MLPNDTLLFWRLFMFGFVFFEYVLRRTSAISAVELSGDINLRGSNVKGPHAAGQGDAKRRIFP